MKESAAQVPAVIERGSTHALIALCLGTLMISVNGTIVNIALPSIGLDLRFSQTSLVWVANGYLVTYGGFLLLGGRLGDLFGHRRLFLIAIIVFTGASLGCGLASSPALLVIARCLQGLGSAILSVGALAQIQSLFADSPMRAKALGINVCVGAVGGSLGLLLGGIVVSALSWRWIYLINVPLGLVVYVLCWAALPSNVTTPKQGRLDICGAATITALSMLLVYTIINGSEVGFTSVQSVALLCGSAGLFVLFLYIETRSQVPLVPLELFRIRSFIVVNVSGALLAAAMLAWNYVSALYLQLVLHMDPLQVGLTCLPANVAIALVSSLVSPRLVLRYGTKRPLVIGMLVTSVGFAFVARTPASTNVIVDVLPGVILVGVGAGFAYGPLLLNAFRDVPSINSGVTSGLFNSTFTLGGALGLSLLASVAAVRTEDLIDSGVDALLALRGGYQVAFYMGAILTVVAALISATFLGSGVKPQMATEVSRATSVATFARMSKGAQLRDRREKN